MGIKDVVLNHGEDYQIVYTTPDPGNGTVIGKVAEGEGGYLAKGGKEEEVGPKGYEHFRSN